MAEHGDELDRPTTAGIYDRLLGGSSHTAAECEAAERLCEIVPEVALGALANRAFHQRAALWLAERAQLRQFLDLGSGLPTQENTHEVVRRIAPDSRVVYVDKDERAAERSKDLLDGVPGTAFIAADICEPASVLNHPEFRRLIDVRKPVALLATAVLHLIDDEVDPWRLMDQYMTAFAPGSYLALSHGTSDHYDSRQLDLVKAIYRNADRQYHPRPRAQVRRFFAGLELVPPYPGARPEVTYGGLWGAEDPVLADDASTRWFYAGVARKPDLPGPQQKTELAPSR
ncbi:class I SAM-dependent methyltransferase [Flindersiella endophytica]